MRKMQAGFREIEHTADWQLEAWAPDLPGLFEQAARGMYSLAGVQLHPEPRVQRNLHLSRNDKEELLVAFLRELLFFGEHEHLAFDHFGLKMDLNQLQADLSGALIANQSKEIKAVTYHNLVIQKTGQEWRVNIVFDV